jgi:hypothetical protein
MLKNVWFATSIWMALNLAPSLVSISIGILVTLVEILAGAVARNVVYLQTTTDGSIASYCLKACLSASRRCRNRSGVAEAGNGICPLALASGMAFFLPSFSYRRYSANVGSIA